MFIYTGCIKNFLTSLFRLFSLHIAFGHSGIALIFCKYVTTMDFKPSVSVLFEYYSLPGPRILTKLGRTKFEKTT